MELYNSLINETKALLESKSAKVWDYDAHGLWKDTGMSELVLQKDAAFELGASGKGSANYVLFTSNAELVNKDQVILCGKDLGELKGDCDFARVVLLRVGVLDEDEIDESSVIKCSIDIERRLDAHSAVKLHAGPGFVQRNIRNGNQVQRVQENEVRFIFDEDVYSTEKVKIAAVAETLETIHTHADSIFSDAINTVLHDAMEPTYL